ncbi:stomatin-like protein 2, mitochondrial [Osmia bicornis bicornis]|uniref:stomatin-like protein 2, mitochondrial n=1 Tax=Osmia bicornis bicornis TaxID=1437191 RepID=UPI0010F57E3B|nr:stomatin-like protein 2, mitochondrial [Osmia bicornis bicornis]XP_029034996.1 stomatin-like protein 2, mitochondrial [Osmia bicornis bicornis]
MLLRTYSWEMNCRFKSLARNFGVLKHQPVFGFEHPALKLPITQLVRYKSETPMNTIILFVPQQEAWIVERMGKFHKVLEPGFNLLMPLIDDIRYVQSLKELAIEIPQQSAVTSDNVTLNIDGVLYLRVNDPYLASYGVEDPEFAVVQLAQTTMRSELGKIALDKVFREREGLNVSIVESINKASEAWGITCLRYEIRDIRLPPRVQEAMQMQVEAERKKRAAVLESEGTREAEINIAEGKRLAQILASEAAKQEEINKANGKASAIIAIAEARAKSLKLVGNALSLTDAKNAAAYSIAEQYVKAFNELAKVNNTLILPSNVSDVSSQVAQAMTIYKQVLSRPSLDNGRKGTRDASLDLHDADESFEYFSDKEEAEKHRESKRKRNPEML